MSRTEIILTGIVAMVFTGLLVSPALAHRKYRPNPLGPPRWVLVRHSHEEAPLVKSTTTTQSDAKKFDLLGGAFDVVAGALKVVGNTAEAILGGEEKAAGEAEKAKPAKISSRRREYRYVPNHSGGGPRWIRKRIR